MALPINIEDLITGRTIEWERIEFKKGWNPVGVLHSICAFANDINNWGGGYIVIAIEEEKGRPVLPPAGLDTVEIDEIQKELLHMCNRLKPHYFPIVEPVLFKDRHILIVWLHGGQNRPFQSPVSLVKKPEYAYYIRRFSSTVKAKIDEVKELLSLAGTIPFDDRIHHGSEIADLKLTLIQSYLHEVRSALYKKAADMPFEQLCRQMMVVDGAEEYTKPRNVGLLFFNDKPQKFIPMSQIEIVQFPSSPGGDRLNEKIFQGPIDHQIRGALTHLKNMYVKEFVRKVPERAEAIRFFNYPYVALEESVVNAMYHRSYEISEPVEIRVHPDRIEILSFPGPDRSIKQTDIQKGVLVGRRYRNRRIGEFLKELELTEGRCTGIPKIIRAMKDNGSPSPVFKTDDERTYFVTILNIHPEAIDRLEEEQPLTDRETKILKFCRETPRKRKEILEHIGLSNKYENYKRHIAPLVSKEFLVMSNPGNPNDRNQRYAASGPGRQSVTQRGQERTSL
jgi:ATP-dependent DNA helicase RecG